MIVDAHVRLGAGRDAALDRATLISTMDTLGIGAALMSPAERHIAYHNREGNALTTDVAAMSGGRLLAYAVANPWRGAEALTELAWAAGRGAVALAVDPTLQGFDLLDGLVDPLLRFAAARDWPVYVRTGTPPAALPLPLAELARRHPDVAFIMGRSGGTDFWIDAAPALHRAPNLYADTAYAPRDSILSAFAADPVIGARRVVFSTDAPYTVPHIELARVTDWPLPDSGRAAVLGGTIQRLVPKPPPHHR